MSSEQGRAGRGRARSPVTGTGNSCISQVSGSRRHSCDQPAVRWTAVMCSCFESQSIYTLDLSVWQYVYFAISMLLWRSQSVQHVFAGYNNMLRLMLSTLGARRYSIEELACPYRGYIFPPIKSAPHEEPTWPSPTPTQQELLRSPKRWVTGAAAVCSGCIFQPSFVYNKTGKMSQMWLEFSTGSDIRRGLINWFD